MDIHSQTPKSEGKGICGRRAEILLWDGRLDNRADLISQLRGSLQSDTSDAAIALAVWERWGVDGFARLIGDWSLVLRDPANQATVLASDFAGVRPLYYKVQQGQVLFSSWLHSIATADAFELDERYVAGLLMFGGCPNHTPYRNILSVPPGHAVIVSGNGTILQRFWTLPVGDEIRYRDERRYEEQFRWLFREAVAVRLSSDAPVLAEVSGGLDSSSVVSMANSLMRNGEVKASRLSGVSYVWKNSLDEPFIREVESFCGIEGLHIPTNDVPLLSEMQPGRMAPRDFEPLHTAVAANSRRLGAKVFLTGLNGDLITGNWFDDSLQVAGALRHLRLGRVCTEALSWSKMLGLPLAWILWRSLRAALPPSMAPAAVYRMSDGSYAPDSDATSLRPDFQIRQDPGESSAYFSNRWMDAVPERRRHFRALAATLELRTLQPPEPLQHLDYTHPFAHRPLVEFLMAVPPDILCGPGNPRKLMRHALSDLWPEKLRRRKSKGFFNAPWLEALQPIARRLLKSRQFQVVERGFVERASLISRLEKLSGGLECNEPQLRQIIMLELWLRNRQAGEQTSIAA